MNEITAATLRSWLYDGAELALIDVREPGQCILAHILFSAPLPYSRFESDLPRLVPNHSVRMVLCDAGDGVATKAAAAAEAMGYTGVHVLGGGVASWTEAGHTLYEGVNVPSKAFGELVEHAQDTPRLTASEIAKRQQEGANMVIVDGRPLEEFRKFSIPGASCCPNGELALRASAFAPDPETTVIVNCAGRTRSIIGAQTLIDVGIPNPVYAMENGTQGWMLSGMVLDEGKDTGLPDIPGSIEERKASAAALARRHGVETVAASALSGWLADTDRTVYLLDVRTADERASDPASRASLIATHGVVHAPGGQLVQATDQWIGVRNAAIVVLDTEDLRAPVTASWLRRLGHQAFTLEGGLDALDGISAQTILAGFDLPELPGIAAATLATRMQDEDILLLDLRSSISYQAGHIAGARWAIRPRLPETGAGQTVVLAAKTAAIAALAAQDLKQAGAGDVLLLEGDAEAWRAAGLEMTSSTDDPPTEDRIDFLSFTAGRHDGDEAASRRYLEWEIALVDQLDEQERAVFKI